MLVDSIANKITFCSILIRGRFDMEIDGTKPMETDHEHDYSQIARVQLTNELRDMGIRGIQWRTCACGEQQLFLLEESGEWQQSDSNDPICRFIDFWS
jgi:hypothetical protein